MDETNDLPGGEEMTADVESPVGGEAEPAGDEPCCECEQGEAETVKSTCCNCGRPGLLKGLMAGAVAGGALARLLAPLRAGKQAPEGDEAAGGGQGLLLAQTAVAKVEGIACGAVSRAKAAWAEMRLRLREAVEEGKEGIGEGEEEARLRYEYMTKRRRHGGRRN